MFCVCGVPSWFYFVVCASWMRLLFEFVVRVFCFRFLLKNVVFFCGPPVVFFFPCVCGVRLRCAIVVYDCGVRLCCATVLCECVVRLCCATVLCVCAVYLWSASVLCDCAERLC